MHPGSGGDDDAPQPLANTAQALTQSALPPAAVQESAQAVAAA